MIRNLTARHAAEHGIYVLETDGYRLERFKAFFNADYGVLAFTSDHGLMQKCDAAGSGDSGLYPGGSPETGEQTVEGKRRYNTEIRYCDMRHNAAGYSGTDGNGVWLHHNNLYDNANGFTTDVFTASGHPGFPQDSDLLEKNKFYSNNFNPYTDGSDVRPTTRMPVGTGMWIAGGNNNIVRNNWFFDNWRRGTMLFAVPNVLVCECADPLGPRLPPNRSVHVAPQQVLRQQDGSHPEGQAPAERNGLLVGRVGGQRQQLLVQEHRHKRHRGEHHVGADHPAFELRHEHRDGRHARAVDRVAHLRRRGSQGDPTTAPGSSPRRSQAASSGPRRFRRARARGLRGRLARRPSRAWEGTPRCAWPTATTGTPRAPTSDWSRSGSSRT